MKFSVIEAKKHLSNGKSLMQTIHNNSHLVSKPKHLYVPIVLKNKETTTYQVVYYYDIEECINWYSENMDQYPHLKSKRQTVLTNLTTLKRLMEKE